MNPGCRVQDQLNSSEPTAPYVICRELNLRKLPGRQWESNPQPSKQLRPMTIKTSASTETATTAYIHGRHVKPFETRIDAQSLLTFAAFVTGSMMEGCPGHLLQQQSGHSTYWFPPPTSRSSEKSEKKIAYAEKPDAWISGSCGRTLIWQIEFVWYAAAAAASLRRLVTSCLHHHPTR